MDMPSQKPANKLSEETYLLVVNFILGWVLSIKVRKKDHLSVEKSHN